MKNTKRWLSIFCLVLALLMLTACRAKKAEVSAPAATPIVVYVTPVPTATPEPGTTPVPTATPEGNATPATPVPTLPPLEPAATKAPAAATPAPTKAPTPAPTPTPLNSAPVITKSPTDERLSEWGTCLFVARADYATGIVWHFVSPDGYTDLEYSSIYSYFPSLSVSGGTENTLRLSNVPYDLNGWRVYCRFSNSLGSSSSGQAVVSVAPTPTPVPVTPAPEPEPAYDDTDYSTDYSGTYYETIAGRGVMTISGSPSYYDVTVTWSSSAFESSTWTFSGTFDSSGTMYFSNCSRVTDTYYEDGSYDSTVDYAWATGTLSTTGANGLVWNVNGDSDISGSVFQ